MKPFWQTFIDIWQFLSGHTGDKETEKAENCLGTMVALGDRSSVIIIDKSKKPFFSGEALSQNILFMRKNDIE